MTSKVESMVFPDALGIRGDVDSVENSIQNLTFICTEDIWSRKVPKMTTLWWFQKNELCMAMAMIL